jgi:hypothetical protein
LAVRGWGSFDESFYIFLLYILLLLVSGFMIEG